MKKILAIGIAASMLSPLFSHRDDHNGMHDQNGMNGKKKENNDFRFWEENDPMWYAGFGGLVLSEFTFDSDDTNFELHDSTTAVKTRNNKQKQPGVGFAGVIGYQVNKVISFEMFYAQTAWNRKFESDTDFNPNSFSLDSKDKIEEKGLVFGPRTLVAIPISKWFAPYFIGGFIVGYDKLQSKWSDDRSQPSTNTRTATSWKAAYAQGYGIRSHFTDNMGVRLEYYVPFFDNSNGSMHLTVFAAF
jgi:opacity protein-like surface antigen